MHNTNSWGPADGFWWKDVHPLLVGSKTRAVFSGNPDGYNFKFSYVVQDGIKYIQSNTYPVNSAWHTAKAQPKRKALCKQLDNIQYVKVNGDDVKIKTIVLGATTSDVRSRRFWEKVERIDSGGSAVRRQVEKLKSTLFNTPKRTVIVLSFLIFVGFLGGIVFMLIFQRTNKD